MDSTYFVVLVSIPFFFTLEKTIHVLIHARVTGSPLIATLPHFYKAEQLLDGIESGLDPNKTFHELYVHLEIVSLRLLS